MTGHDRGSSPAPGTPSAEAATATPRQPVLLVGGRRIGDAPTPRRGDEPHVRRAGVASLLDGRPRTVRAGGATLAITALREPLPAIVLVTAPRSGAGPRLGQLVAEAQGSARVRLLALLEREPLLAVEAARPSLAATCDLLARVAPVSLSVLILGETGAGKEVTARALHAASGRPGPFVAENCAALPESLLEAELFGVRRGAFTGATHDRPGRIASAGGGTLFLDEIGDVPPAIQAKLLRVLQEREIRPLGDDHARPVDVRFVSATHRDLPVLARKGGFRQDLYFRLAGVTVRLPPLRETPADIPFLVAALLARAERDAALPRRSISLAALSLLTLLRLPGNVRELDNILRRALTLAPGPTIDAGTLEACIPEMQIDAENLEAHAILEALELANGVKARAARRLGWTRQKLYRRIAALGLEERLAWSSACARSRSRSS